MQLSVVVPAYNEGDRIFANLLEIADTLASLRTSWEIILVDDGSSDTTHAEAVRAGALVPDLRIFSYPRNQGKGFALRYGAGQARGDLVVLLDADLELHPQQIPVLLEVLDRQGVDFVVGSKRHPELKHPQSGQAFPLSRRILSNMYFLLVTLMFRLPVRDTQAGLKVFRRQALLDVLPAVRTTRFAFDLDLLVHAHRIGYRIAEAPVAARFLRTSSRLTVRDVLRIWADTLQLYWHVLSAGRSLPRRAPSPLEHDGAPKASPSVDRRA